MDRLHRAVCEYKATFGVANSKLQVGSAEAADRFAAHGKAKPVPLEVKEMITKYINTGESRPILEALKNEEGRQAWNNYLYNKEFYIGLGLDRDQRKKLEQLVNGAIYAAPAAQTTETQTTETLRVPL